MPNIWSHFKDFELFKTILKQDQDIFLYGPHKSGKTELIKDLIDKKKKVLRINCLMFPSLTKLRSHLVS